VNRMAIVRAISPDRMSRNDPRKCLGVDQASVQEIARPGYGVAQARMLGSNSGSTWENSVACLCKMVPLRSLFSW
jgi:hypothetical protein